MPCDPIWIRHCSVGKVMKTTIAQCAHRAVASDYWRLIRLGGYGSELRRDSPIAANSPTQSIRCKLQCFDCWTSRTTSCTTSRQDVVGLLYLQAFDFLCIVCVGFAVDLRFVFTRHSCTGRYC